MNRHALFVGVNDYDDEAFKDLRYSLSDAVALSGAFAARGFEVEVLSNPKADAVLGAVERMAAGLGPGDVFLFFFAGHGFTAPDGSHLLICSSDRLAYLRHNRAGIPVDLLEDVTNGHGCNRAFLLDACRTDVFAGVENRGVETRDLAFVSIPDAKKHAGTCCVLRSCDRFCPAMEFDDLGHGVFTRAVMDMLADESARSTPFGEAFVAGIRSRMRGILSAHNVPTEQNPCFQTNGEAFFLFDNMPVGKEATSPLPVSTVPLVFCPVCGKYNLVTDTFKCKVCGMDNLCLSHSSGTPGVCRSCALEAEAKEGVAAVAVQATVPAAPFEGEEVSDEWWQHESELRAALEAERLAAEKAEREVEEIERAAQAKAEAERKALEKTAARARQEAELQAKLEEVRKKREDAERRAREIREAAARTKTFVLPGGATMEMLWCPPGEFMMGSPETEEGREDDESLHRVRLTKGFWLGKYPVTQKQWESVMGNNPSHSKGDNLPVEQVSWNDCQGFISKVNALLSCCARLPTEAEWEYACRAGTTTAYFWGNALNGDKANCNGNYPCGTKTTGQYLYKTTPVGHYGVNAWGFADMHGNVWEWCADSYGDYPSGNATDPTGPASGGNRVMRGGSWISYARGCRSASRDGRYPSLRNDDCGFRLCCSADPCG